MKKYNFVYKTTFNNGLYYIGQHKTNKLEDNYFGSSKTVKYLVKFHKELEPTRIILRYCNTQEELNKWEKYYIGDNWKNDPKCLNENNICVINEVCSFTKMWQNTETRSKLIKSQTIAQNRPDVKQKVSDASKEMWKDEEFRIKRKQSLDAYWNNEESHKKQSEAQKKRYKNSDDAKKHSEWAKDYYKTHDGNRKNQKCSEEQKQKLSDQSKDRTWLSKEGERSILVKKDKIDYYINKGYHFGRK